ncbi:tetratricopeptide repeat protein [Nioella sp.]|uniref:tetratricopeptide repeat protein n=1 Tax=Nioella sp. TaxID=1912091 RepID=UPI003B52C866
MNDRFTAAREAQSRARFHLAQDDAAGALSALEAGLVQFPDDAVLCAQKLGVLRQLGRGSEAWLFGQSLPVSVRDGSVLPILIELALEHDDGGAARELLREAETSDMKRVRYLQIARKVVEQTEGADAALFLLDAHQSESGRSPQLTREYTRLLVLAGRLDDAVDVLEAAMAHSPSPLLILTLVKLELGKGRFDRVDALLQQHSGLAETQSDWHLFSIRSADRQSDLSLALSRAEVAVQQFPDNRDLNEAHWRLLSRLGQQSSAIEHCQAYAERRSAHLASQLAAIRFLLAAKQEEPCKDIIDRAERLAPDSLDVLRARARFHLAQDDAAGALSALEAGLVQFPDDAVLCAQKLGVLRQLGRGSEAWLFGQSLPVSVRDGSVLPILIELALEHDDGGAARELLREAETSDMKRVRYLQIARKVVEQTEGADAALSLLDAHQSESGRSPQLTREYTRLLVLAGRLDDAVDVLEAAMAHSPSPLLILTLVKLELGKGRFDRVDALLQQHSGLAETQSDWHLFSIRSADRQSDLSLALSRAEVAVQQFPDNRDLNEAHWRLLSRLGQQSSAIEHCQAYAERRSAHLASQLAAIRFLLAAKQEEPCKDIIDRAERLAPDSLDVLRARARFHLAQDDAMGAKDVLKTVFDTPNLSPDFEIFLASVDKAIGNYTQAIDRLEKSLRIYPGHAQMSLKLARLLVLLGYSDRAREVLDKMPNGGMILSREQCLTRAAIALIEVQPGEAKQFIKQAIAYDPTRGELWSKRSQIELALGMTADAWQSHLKAMKLRVTNDVTGRSNNKVRSSIPGQILNEYRLSEPPEIQRHSAVGADQRKAMRYFRSHLEDNPSSMTAALCLLGAMWRAGQVTESFDESRLDARLTSRIPKQVFQFWDSRELPDQVAAVINENKALNPDFEFRRFSEQEARSYLAEKGETEALRGFRLAPHAAAKADIFRLAVLWYEGGVYMDADDRSLNPLSSFLNLRCRFVGFQEPMMSVGNNFLAVQPKDPIIRSALESASIAFSATQGESIWLATGPGAVTRAVALHGTKKDGTLSAGVWLMPMHRLQRDVATHIRLSYKSTAMNWFSTLKTAH